MSPAETTRTMVVTGAGAGIGASIARAASGSGWTVGVLDVDGAAARSVAADLERAVALEAPVNDEERVREALDGFESSVDAPLDAVVNNAGIVRFGTLAELSLGDWREVLEVNLTGSFVVARDAARRMSAAGGGAIVNVTSINGVLPGPNAGAYGASKAGIALLTQQLALEFGPSGVRANSVAPGFIDGGMSAPLYADPETRSVRTSAVPLGRLGTPQDVASVVLWLASEDSAYVSGANLVVDGGVAPSLLANLPRPASVDGVGRGGAER